MKTSIVKFSTIMLLLATTFPAISTAQDSKTWVWASNIRGTNKNYPYSLYTDKNGNNYVAGSFSDTLIVGKTRLISKGSFDIYLLKYDDAGNLIWAKQAGGTDSDEAYGIALDGQGNIFMTGYFSGTAGFSGKTLTSSGDRDFFIAKYLPSGDLDWVKQGGGIQEDYGTAVATDGSGNVFITGIFRGTMTVGNTAYISKGDKDIFVIKYDSQGQIVWSATGGGNLADESTSIITDKSGNCYVAGDFEGLAKFGKSIVISAGKKDIFLAKYNSNGEIQWLKREGSATGDDHASALAADNSGNIYMTGYFSGLANFGQIELKNVGSEDIFLLKITSDGNEIWAKQTGGKGNERGHSLILNAAGDIYVCGEFNADFTFGQNNIKNLGDWDIFVIKYDKAGEMLGGTQLSGIGFDRAYGIGLDNSANIYLTGFFSKAINVGSTILKSIDADDGFIAKLKGL